MSVRSNTSDPSNCTKLVVKVDSKITASFEGEDLCITAVVIKTTEEGSVKTATSGNFDETNAFGVIATDLCNVEKYEEHV